ncbi:MAG: ribonuclease J, partial [Archaeoglobaceae archaeon]|nr:ribonuclease J [Archaeoglobaceae archaeon]MDW8118850.1 MBL fold metallo-hydrolase RNA specificity domain-containing protein [Archaeoglobaceae archaeon]
IYKELKSEREKWETEVVMDLFGDKYLDPESIRRCPDRYILCFSYYDIKHLLDIKPQKGVYIYSSSEAFNEEQEFDFRRLYEWLKVFNFETVGFRIEKDETYFEKGYHTSGHASKEDLSWIIEKIDPDVVIPVHTEKADWFEEEFENAKILKNGESYEF